MHIAVDISLYPLTEDYIPPIKGVIERLNGYDELDVETNPMSTQIRGDYDTVMHALATEMKRSFEQVPKSVFAIRVINLSGAE